MRLALLVLALMVAAPTRAQGRYLRDGFGVSGSISALPQPATAADVAFLETGVVAVVGRLEVEGAYGWYVGERVEGYAVGARVGFLVMRQKQGGPATVALRTGLAFGEARAVARYRLSTVQQTSFSLEAAHAIEREGGAQVTPFASGTLRDCLGKLAKAS